MSGNLKKAVLTGLICVFASMTLWADSALHAMYSGFTRNHSSGVWTATLKVNNASSAAVSGPIRVAITNLSANATLMNASGENHGVPYITLSDSSLAAGGTIAAPVQFTNSSNAFITFTPVVLGGN